MAIARDQNRAVAQLQRSPRIAARLAALQLPTGRQQWPAQLVLDVAAPGVDGPFVHAGFTRHARRAEAFKHERKLGVGEPRPDHQPAAWTTRSAR
jgi:hypothetical protein